MEEYVVWGDDFRLPTLVQPPRVMRFGARLEF
jgi:hypothetical protein